MSRVKPITRAERRQLHAALKQAIEQYRATLDRPEEASETEALRHLAGTGKPLDDLRHVPPNYLLNIIAMVTVTARQAQWFADGRGSAAEASEASMTEDELVHAAEVLDRGLKGAAELKAQIKAAVRIQTTIACIPRALAPHHNTLSVRSRLIGRVKGAVLTYCGQPQYALVMALSDIVLGFKTGMVKKAWVYEAATPAELLGSCHRSENFIVKRFPVKTA
jgi:hypothetical protein